MRRATVNNGGFAALFNIVLRTALERSGWETLKVT
jgi:hypothetical protein